jgi:hypothetical protein
MMSPQASFAYNYGYGFSPRRPGSQKKRPNKSVGVEKDGRNDVSEVGNTQAASITPPRTTSNKIRQSPATVDTTDESESLG